MEAVKASGRAKIIGVSNFVVAHLEKILCDGSELTAVNQVGYSIYLQRTELYEFCQKHGIFMQAFAPLLPCIVAAGGPVESLLSSLSAKHGVSRSGRNLYQMVYRQRLGRCDHNSSAT